MAAKCAGTEGFAPHLGLPDNFHKRNLGFSPKKIKKECTNVEIFDTICNATYNRQREAKALSKQCEVMIVIGDPQSSNTRHLAELCRMCCDRVIWVESAEELSIQGLADVASVGITAGASTPGWIIKEVKNKMSEERFEIEESFAEMLEKSIKTLNTGDKVDRCRCQCHTY